MLPFPDFLPFILCPLLNFFSDFSDMFLLHQHDLPGAKDLKGTAEALMRLQDTYQLSPHNIFVGNIKGK